MPHPSSAGRKGEMLADVAEAGCTQQSVGDGVEDDVGIAVTGEAALMCDLHSAEHDRSRASEGVDVEAHARSGRQPAGEPLLGAIEVGLDGELLQRRIAVDGGDFHPGRAKHRSFVGWRLARPLIVCGFERAKAEGLRGLYPDHARAFHGSPSVSPIRASVSETGRTGAAPSKNSRLARSRSMTSDGQKGRAAS